MSGQANEVAQVRSTSGDGRNAVVRMLGRRASLWVVTAVVAHTLWTSAAPSMTYRLYDWLNRVVAVGIGHRQADGPIYSIFEVL